MKNKNNSQSKIDTNDLYNYFKQVNEADVIDTANEDFIIHTNTNDTNENHENTLNATITENEINKCINNLNNNKACAKDNIINEYIKSTAELKLPVYRKLFNLVLDTGIMPSSWLSGNYEILKMKKKPLYSAFIDF